jgi:hypothetical protein
MDLLENYENKLKSSMQVAVERIELSAGRMLTDDEAKFFKYAYLMGSDFCLDFCSKIVDK